MYLARVDVHSAVVSTALQDQLPGIVTAPGYRADGLLSRQAHHLARGRMDRLFTDAERRSDASTALLQAASLGVGAVHELGGPHLGPIEDLIRVREVADELGIGLVCYWGELASTDVLAKGRSVGAAGLAGDLCIDGSIGSHTASLFEAYRDQDAANHRGKGTRYLSVDEIADHVIKCTRAGVQAGFHCIGDEAVAAAAEGLRRAASVVGLAALRRGRHRLEHVEMAAEADFATLATYGVIASMQPAFDALWGGPGALRAAARRSTGGENESVGQPTSRWGRIGPGNRLAGDPAGGLGDSTSGGSARGPRNGSPSRRRSPRLRSAGIGRPGSTTEVSCGPDGAPTWLCGRSVTLAGRLPGCRTGPRHTAACLYGNSIAGRQIYGSQDWGFPQHDGPVPEPCWVGSARVSDARCRRLRGDPGETSWVSHAICGGCHRGPGGRAQLAALRPLALLLVGLPTFTLAVAGGRLARAPSMSDSAPPTPSVSRAPGSRALSRAKDMGSQALGLWTGRDSVTPSAVLRAWLCLRFGDARGDDQLGSCAGRLDRVDPHRLRVALLRSAWYGPASHLHVAGLAAGGRVLLGDDRVRVLPCSVRRLGMDAVGLRCGRYSTGRLPANHWRGGRVLSRRLDRSSPGVGLSSVPDPSDRESAADWSRPRWPLRSWW